MRWMIPYLKNKYIVSIVALVIWLMFFDQNNWIDQIGYKLELKELKEDKLFYQEEIKKATKDLEDIKSNPNTLERFAREKYLMKKDNEEVFVIVREDR